MAHMAGAVDAAVDTADITGMKFGNNRMTSDLITNDICVIEVAWSDATRLDFGEPHHVEISHLASAEFSLGSLISLIVQ